MEIRNEIGKEEEKSLPTFGYGGRRRLRTLMADPDGQKVASGTRNDISQNGLDPTVNNEDLILTRFESRVSFFATSDHFWRGCRRGKERGGWREPIPGLGEPDRRPEDLDVISVEIKDSSASFNQEIKVVDFSG
ncbi:hypothetical protein GQ457_16G017390 [Hibiscus cannabinus]